VSGAGLLRLSLRYCGGSLAPQLPSQSELGRFSPCGRATPTSPKLARRRSSAPRNKALRILSLSLKSLLLQRPIRPWPFYFQKVRTTHVDQDYVRHASLTVFGHATKKPNHLLIFELMARHSVAKRNGAWPQGSRRSPIVCPVLVRVSLPHCRTGNLKACNVRRTTYACRMPPNQVDITTGCPHCAAVMNIVDVEVLNTQEVEHVFKCKGCSRKARFQFPKIKVPIKRAHVK
jgi:hypothetical protein